MGKLIKMIDKSVEARVTETMFEKIFSNIVSVTLASTLLSIILINFCSSSIDKDLSGKLSIEELQKLIKMIDKSVEARVTETMFEKIFSRENPATRGNLENR